MKLRTRESELKHRQVDHGEHEGCGYVKCGTPDTGTTISIVVACHTRANRHGPSDDQDLRPAMNSTLAKMRQYHSQKDTTSDDLSSRIAHTSIISDPAKTYCSVSRNMNCPEEDMQNNTHPSSGHVKPVTQR